MEYDPIKERLGVVFNRTPLLRRIFYRLLDVLLLRTWHVHRAFRRIAAHLPAHARLLDAGSGFGQYDYYMARRMPAAQIDAVDIKEEQIADCAAFFTRCGLDNVHFRVADLTQLREPGVYHMILSVDVMEHILEDTTVFGHFAASLQPGGVLLLSTPSDLGPDEGPDDGHASFIGEHVRKGYPVEEMRSKLAAAGFSDIRIRYTYSPVGQVAWHLSMQYPILALGKSRWCFLLLPFWYLAVMIPCLVLNALDVLLPHSTGTGLLVEARR